MDVAVWPALATAIGELRDIVAVEIHLEKMMNTRGVGFKNNGTA